MEEELPVCDEASLLHSLVSVCQVLVPEAVIVVPVVDSLWVVLAWGPVNLVDRRIFLRHKVSLNALDFRIDTELACILLLGHDFQSFQLSCLIVKALQRG